MSASGPELTLMLYDGAIKFLNIADVAIEKNDISKAHENIVKTERIIDYLRNTLDMKYPVAQDFENMYSYIARRLVEANIGKDRDILAEVNKHMHSIRDNWIEVMKANHVYVKDA
jgi:flagellar protein FliS